MNEPYPSSRCPKCGQGLLLAAMTSFAFLKKAYCPFCGEPVRLALRPLMLLVLGLASGAAGIYCMSHDIAIMGQTRLAAAGLMGVGLAAALLGVVFFRFICVGTRRKQGLQSRTKAYYPFTS